MSLHIIHLMANNSSVPYFNWFAEEARLHPEVRLTFVALHSERPKMLDDMQARGSRCIWIPFDDKRRKLSVLKAIPALRRLFKKERPDAVHVHLFDDALPGLIAAKLAGVKVRVITKQDTTFHWYYAPKGVKFDRLNNRLATHLVAVSEECKKFILEKEHADPAKLHLIHHGIPPEQSGAQTEERKQNLRERFAAKDRFVIGTVARLIEWKGYRLIIDAAEQLVKEHPQLLFLFAGEGGQKEELERLVKEKKLEQHVRFTGWIERADIPSFYGIMDTYLHAAAFEPFGFVIAEAMLNGAPVVSTATGAAADAIVTGENGYLVSERSAAALAEGIRFMLQADRKTIGEKGRQAALQKYAFRNMWNGYINLYREALK